MSAEMKAVLQVANYKGLQALLLPIIDQANEAIRWDELNYHALSGGQQTVVSWLYSIWTGSLPESEKKWRDPFDGFGNLDSELQVLVLQALAIRHGFTHFTAARTKSDLQKSIENMLK